MGEVGYGMQDGVWDAGWGTRELRYRLGYEWERTE